MDISFFQIILKISLPCLLSNLLLIPFLAVNTPEFIINTLSAIIFLIIVIFCGIKLRK